MPSACVAAPSLSCGAAVKILTHNTIIIIANHVYDSVITIDPNANFFIPFSLLCFGLSAFIVVNQAKFNLTIALLGMLVSRGAGRHTIQREPFHVFLFAAQRQYRQGRFLTCFSTVTNRNSKFLGLFRSFICPGATLTRNQDVMHAAVRHWPR